MIGKSVEMCEIRVRERERREQLEQADEGSGLHLADSLLKWAMQPYLG